VPGCRPTVRGVHRRWATGAKKRTAPEALRRTAAPAGAAQRENHPPMVDLLALASRSTSHRPSCPKAWRAMPRCRPGLRLPGPLPSRCSHAAPDRSEAPLRRREDRCSAEPVGVARRWHRPDHHVPPPGEPVGLPRWPGVDSPCTDAADDDLAEAWVRTVFRLPPPEGDLDQTRFPGPGRRCALRYGPHIAGRIAPGQDLFLNSQGSPQNFFVTHRKRRFIHRSCTAISRAHRTQWVSRSARTASWWFACRALFGALSACRSGPLAALSVTVRVGRRAVAPVLSCT
jgi:hypothetical protein